MSEDGTSPDLVRLTRDTYASLNGRDFEAFAGRFGSTSVWDVSRWGLGCHTGLPAIRSFLEDWFGSFDDYAMHVDDVHDLGNGIVFAVVAQAAPIAPRGGTLRVQSGALLEWEGSTVRRLTLYPSPDEARAAGERFAAERD